jgi:hypothetical protein
MDLSKSRTRNGWADFRLTNYTSIERWWEIVFSAYLLVSLPATNFKSVARKQSKSHSSSPSPIREFSQHPEWDWEFNWKSALKNLRLIIQPYIEWCLIQAWLEVFPIPGMKRSFFKLIEIMNSFRAYPINYAMAS